MANVRKETTAARNVAVLFGKAVRDARVTARLTIKANREEGPRTDRLPQRRGTRRAASPVRGHAEAG